MQLHELSFQNNLEAIPFDSMCPTSFTNLVFDVFRQPDYSGLFETKDKKLPEHAPHWCIFNLVICLQYSLQE